MKNGNYFIQHNPTILNVKKEHEPNGWLIEISFTFGEINGLLDLRYKKGLAFLLDDYATHNKSQDYGIYNFNLSEWPFVSDEEVIPELQAKIINLAQEQIDKLINEIETIEEETEKPIIHIHTEGIEAFPLKGDCYTVEFSLNDSLKRNKLVFPITDIFRKSGLYSFLPPELDAEAPVHFSGIEKYIWDHIRTQSNFRLAFEVLA